VSVNGIKVRDSRSSHRHEVQLTSAPHLQILLMDSLQALRACGRSHGAGSGDGFGHQRAEGRPDAEDRPGDR
jgi:hypothetical protein